jgi:hypothetical protein
MRSQRALKRRLSLSVNWKALSRERHLRCVGDAIRVPCGSERVQIVNVDNSDPSCLRVWSRVASRAQLNIDSSTAESPAVESWLINRYRELVGFKTVERGTVIGEAWVPTDGLTAEEWELHIRTVAKACDRLEYLWTGTDRE